MPTTEFCTEEQVILSEIEPQSFWFNHRNDIIAAVVRQFRPIGQIFDIGGGNGYVSLGLRNAGFDCVVVEPSEAGARNAHLRGIPVIQTSIQQMAGPIPSAGMFDVLEHIEDDAAALAGLHRLMTRGARLYVTVPAYHFLWSREDVDARHFRPYHLGGLGSLLRSVGFSIDYATYFFAPLIAPILLMRVMRFRRTTDPHKDHTMPSGPIGRLLQQALRRELEIIASGGVRRIGSSCLIVARHD